MVMTWYRDSINGVDIASWPWFGNDLTNTGIARFIFNSKYINSATVLWRLILRNKLLSICPSPFANAATWSGGLTAREMGVVGGEYHPVFPGFLCQSEVGVAVPSVPRIFWRRPDGWNGMDEETAHAPRTDVWSGGGDCPSWSRLNRSFTFSRPRFAFYSVGPYPKTCGWRTAALDVSYCSR